MDISLVILSGQADQRIAVEWIRHGAADYLIKDSMRDERLTIPVGNVVSTHRNEVSARGHAEALSKLASGTAGVVGKDYVHALVRQLDTAFLYDKPFLQNLAMTWSVHVSRCGQMTVFSGQVAFVPMPFPSRLSWLRTHPSH